MQHAFTPCRRPTHDPSIDTFKIEYLLGPCLFLALIFNYHFTPTEILWAFSIYLESVAIFPQLFMLQRTGEAETITTHYLAALGIYRALYIPNWIYRYVAPCGHVKVVLNPMRLGHYRYFVEDVVDPIAVVAGLVQTGLYLDFFYVYVTKWVSHCVSRSILMACHFRVRIPGGVEYCRVRSLNYRHEYRFARTTCYSFAERQILLLL